MLGAALLPLLPPRLNPERQQDRADDHHAFHEDAKPGDLNGQLGTRRFSSSKKLMTVGVAVPFLLCTPLVVVIVLA